MFHIVLYLYRSFEYIGGITHTHSLYATAWAQAVKPIPCLGTTHADYWKGAVPVSRPLTNDEIKGEYEMEYNINEFENKISDADALGHLEITLLY